MNELIQHIHDTGIDLPPSITDHQLRILCEVVIRACNEYVTASLWAEPGDLLDHYDLEQVSEE
jgi:hypothetical protein